MISDTVHKVIIVGSGPSGYAASIYTARAFLKPLLFAGEQHSGQLMFTTEVENYPGFENGIMGPDLMGEMRKQAQRFGTTIFDKNVTKVDFSQKPFTVFQNDKAYYAESVIITTGATSIRLGVPGEDRLLGRGVATCAVCDAPFYRNKKTFVVGGGDAAIEDAMALTKYADSVTMVVRKDSFRASKIMQEKVLSHPKIAILWNSQVVEVEGETRLESVSIHNNKTSETVKHHIDGLFLAIGHKPATEIFKGQLDLDEKGYIITRLGLGKTSISLAHNNTDSHGLLAYPTMTSVEGVFAGGDVVDFRYRQAITAAGFGTMAALDAEWYLERGSNKR